MLIVFIICAGVPVYVFLGYPFILCILAILTGKSPLKDDIYPTVSLIISTYNEEKIIAKKLENALALDYPKDKLEIVVASESVDKTNEVVKQFDSQNVVLYEYAQREGKAATLFKTVPKAKSEIIVFSDANAMYEKEAIKKLVRNFNDKRIGCVSGQLKYLNPNINSSGIAESLYWKYEMGLKKLESRLFSLLGANGSIFAIRKELYLPVSKECGDDFELPIMINQKGYGVVLEPDAVSWEMCSNTVREEFERKVRIIAWNTMSCLILLKKSLTGRKWLLVFQLISHKLLRWLIPIFAMGLLVSNVFLPGLFFRIVLVLQTFFYTAASISCMLDKMEIKLSKPLLLPYYVCVIYCASIIGLYRLICHKQKTVWKKVRA
jgi:cellulose synthase/poly-beta-1,6-N-acetylglucosamine synthase-like glycosyltransferase